jgi:hypothetical protein
MKKTIIVGLLISGSLFACNGGSDNSTENKLVENSTTGSTNSLVDFTKNFVGKINDKYEIVMSLTKTGNDIIGTYKYKSQNSSLKLKGTVDNSGNLNINEFNDKGSISGVFKGKIDASNIVGTWEKPDGSKSFNFTVYEDKTVASTADDNTKWTGTYEDKFGAILKVTGPADDGAVKFKFEIINEKCQSEYDGTAYLTKAGVANFDGENGSKCHLNFTFNDNEITVEETDCFGELGAACSFGSTYKKKK